MAEEIKAGNILVMEDEELVSTIAIQMLEFIGYSASLAINGDAAIELYRESFQGDTPFTAVIMDLSIPGGMGGEEAVKEVLKIDPDAKVIVSSGNSHDPAMVKYRDFGFSAAISKPFNIADLTQVLDGLG